MQTYKCWLTKDEGCTTDYCETLGNMQPCKDIDKCPVYKYYKKKEMEEWK